MLDPEDTHSAIIDLQERITSFESEMDSVAAAINAHSESIKLLTAAVEAVRKTRLGLS